MYDKQRLPGYADESRRKLSLVVACFLEQIHFLMEISFTNVNFPANWGNLYFL